MSTCYNCFKEKSNNEETCPHCGYTDSGEMDEHYYLPQGTILHDRYTIGRVLGHGGFGITYVGHDNKLDILVAIKEYLPTDVASRAIGETTVTTFSGEKKDQYEYGLVRFLDEAKTLARYNQHPCIVSTTDFFETNNTAYLVMEFLDGISLNEYLKRKGGKITWHTTYEIMMPVIDALREVHQSGMIHRDVSPDNIYITKTGQIKLLDFGAARFALSEKSKSLSVVLKPGYAPPEQYSTKGKQGPWTDVYAVAATMYRMLTGSTPPEAVDRVMNDEMVGLKAQQVELDNQVEAAIIQALAVNGGDRQQSIEALREGLIVKAPEKPAKDMVQIEPVAYHGDIAVSESPKAEANEIGEVTKAVGQSGNKYIMLLAGVLLLIGFLVSFNGDIFFLARVQEYEQFFREKGAVFIIYLFIAVLFMTDYLGLTLFAEMSLVKKMLVVLSIGILLLRILLSMEITPIYSRSNNSIFAIIIIILIVVMKVLYLFGKSWKLKRITFIIEKALFLILMFESSWDIVRYQVFDIYWFMHMQVFEINYQSIGLVVAAWLMFGLMFIKQSKKVLALHDKIVLGIIIIFTLFMIFNDFWIVSIPLFGISVTVMIINLIKKPLWNNIDRQLLVSGWLIIMSMMLQSSRERFESAFPISFNRYGPFLIFLLVYAFICQWLSIRKVISNQVKSVDAAK